MTAQEITTLGLLIIAALALILNFWQARTNIANQTLITANSVFAQYLQEAVKYPNFVNPSKEVIDCDSQKFSGSHDEFLRYEFFVDTMLTSFELIFHFGRTNDWKHEMMIHFEGHRIYLSSNYFWRYERAFEPAFASFLKWCVFEHGSAAE